eukprot:CAMPEP_0170636702 /NCGR_PEP_ID=MMETSP0224-20130122/37974_1 /TAXON_ID=285029 /ORGANISM="Togula jolla, Strain CCCM 725" /LENGTH=52 /DNA_ID=CAMNT_0010966443 /DNA_START=250 /DNA_END=405 /DNA_ORIENTATION=-
MQSVRNGSENWLPEVILSLLSRDLACREARGCSMAAYTRRGKPSGLSVSIGM